MFSRLLSRAVPRFADCKAAVYLLEQEVRSRHAAEEKAFTKIEKTIRLHPRNPLGLSPLSPTLGKMFIATTEATVGGKLSLEVNGEKPPMDFFSRNLIKTQRYSIYEKEATAILEGLRHWQRFQLNKPFRIETDRKSLNWLLLKRTVQVN